MADTVTTQVLNDAARHATLLLTNVSDGTGETAVKKVDLAALNPQPEQIKIKSIRYATNGMGVRILWEAAVNQLAWVIPQDSSDHICFEDIGCLQPPAVAGLTGNLLFTTNGDDSGDSYSILIDVLKKSD